MYVRRGGDRELTFDFAEGLVKNNLLVVDRETSSVWSQLDNKAISGPLKETPMTIVPSIQATWRFWRETHPDTSVMVVEGKKGRRYLYRNRKIGGPRPKERPTTHDTSALGLGLSRNGEAIFMPFHELEHARAPFEIKLGGEHITIHCRVDALTAWATDAKGKLLPAVLSYAQGWMDFNPGSKLYASDVGEP